MCREWRSKMTANRLGSPRDRAITLASSAALVSSRGIARLSLRPVSFPVLTGPGTGSGKDGQRDSGHGREARAVAFTIWNTGASGNSFAKIRLTPVGAGASPDSTEPTPMRFQVLDILPHLTNPVTGRRVRTDERF